MLSTFRVKISLVAAAIVVALVIVMYLVTVMPLSTIATEGVQKSVERASSLVVRSQKLHGYDLVALAQEVAARKEFIDGVLTETEQQRRVNIFDAISQFDKELKAKGRKAHFFGVLDREGAIIARDLDINNMYGDKLPFDNIKQALQGNASKDIWRMKNSMMRAAAAPILQGGKVIGAVAIAYDFTAAEAREERDQFGTQVAYFMENTIRSSSFSLPGDDNTEDAARVAALNKALLGGANAPGNKALAEDKSSQTITLDLHGAEYLAITGPLPVRLTHKNVGYVVLASLDEAQAPVSRVRWMFLVFGLVTLLLVLGGMWTVSRHFVDEEDKLELGVNEVINGNMDYTFEDIKEFEGLANAINVMLARLLGRPEPGEEEDGESAWRADVLFIEEVTGDHTTEARKAVQMVSEQEDAYYARVHREYIAARQRYNLPTEGITLDSLTQKLKANEALLKAKYKCKAVRFEVREEAGKVSLKPTRIS
jgi:hypothetical protein